MSNHISFFLSDEVRKLFNHFTALFDIRIAYFTPDGQELTVGLDRSWCDYCTLLRRELGDDGLCVKEDRAGREAARMKKDLVSYRCHGGLLEAVKPVIAYGELIGFIMIGQVRIDDALPHDKRVRWNDLRGDESLAASWGAVPRIPRVKMDHILPLFSSLVDLIIACHMIAILGRHPLDPIFARMAEHPDEMLRLSDVAGMVGKSRSRTAHLFTEVYGKSFKVMQREIRMTKAAELLTASKGAGIKEIAARCGYEDPLYFSRVFRKHYGIPPSKIHASTG